MPKPNAETLDQFFERPIPFVDKETAQPEFVDYGYRCEQTAAIEVDELTQHALDMLRKYLNGVLLTDQFKNHRDAGDGLPNRSDWEKKQQPMIQQVLDTNRLRINNLFKVSATIDALAYDLKTSAQDHNPQIQALIQKLELASETIKENKNQTKEFQLTLEEIAQRQGKTDLRAIIKNGFYPDRLIELARQQNKSIYDLIDDYQLDKDDVVTLKADDSTKGYDTLSLDQKVKLVRTVTEACVEALEFFGYQVTARKVKQQ